MGETSDAAHENSLKNFVRAVVASPSRGEQATAWQRTAPKWSGQKHTLD
jgi:hypothetical protein